MEAGLAEQRERLDERQQTLDEIERTLTRLRADFELEQQAAAESARAVEARSAALAQRDSDLAAAEADFGARTAALARREREVEAAEREKLDTLGRLRHQAADLAERERALVRLGAMPTAQPAEEAPKIPASFREGLAALEASERRAPAPARLTPEKDEALAGPVAVTRLGPV